MPTIAEQLEWWTKQATHDLEVGKANRGDGFHDTCALMCQQSVEKFLKAVFMKRNNATPPKLHQCEHLAMMVGAPPDVVNAARVVESSYMKSRYPDAAHGVPFEQFGDADSQKYLQAADEVQQWVLQQLKPTP